MEYISANRLEKYNGKKINYDADGNMTYGPLNNTMANYSYDKANKLIKAGNTEYFYDGEGLRIKQTTNGKSTTCLTDLTGTLSRLLLKSNADGTEEIYVYANGLISQETKINENNKPVYKNNLHLCRKLWNPNR